MCGPRILLALHGPSLGFATSALTVAIRLRGHVDRDPCHASVCVTAEASTEACFYPFPSCYQEGQETGITWNRMEGMDFIFPCVIFSEALESKIMHSRR